MKIQMVLIAAAALVVGCATVEPVASYRDASASEVTGGTVMHTAGRVRTVEAPPIIDKTLRSKANLAAFDRYDERVVRLRAAVADGAPVRHQLYVDVNYVAEAWRMYRLAVLPDGSNVRLTVIERSVVRCGLLGGCEYREIVGVPIPEKQLRGQATPEIRILSKENTDERVSLPRSYVDGYLAAIPR